MRTAVRAGGFGTLLAVVLGLAWAAGSVIRPGHPTVAPTPQVAAAPGAPAAATPSTGPSDEVALVPRTTLLDPGRPGEYTFTLTGPLDAAPRLTAVRGDAAVLARSTPVAAPDGTWHAPLTLPAPGPYRVVVTVAPPGGPPRNLTADLLAPGPFEPVRFPPARVAEVDGYQVRLDGDLVPGAAAQVFATVSSGGQPLTDLEPVDGAFGRLDAVREGDLALAPVHPDAAPRAPTDRAGPGIAFTTEVPGAGTYRLFLDFRHGGVQRTAVFTVPTGSTG
jgi:hypothetical protein